LQNGIIVPLRALASLDKFAFGPFAAHYLAIELTQGETASTDWLRRLPCPVLGVGAPHHVCAQACDIIVPQAHNLEGIIANIEATPIAATTLVEVLRTTEKMPVPEALTVESLAYATLQGGAENRAWLARRARCSAPAIDVGPPLEIGQPLLVGRNGNALTLTLNRPHAFNAINVALRDALAEGLALAEMDASITDITLNGAGRCFSIGGALEEFGTSPDQATAHAVRSMAGPAFRLAAVANRSTARVQGACIGAGLELAALCRRVIARENAFFQLPEIKFGLIPGSGGTVGVARRIGRHRAAYLALSARRISARRALEWGLIDEIAR
jgi:hypothetical protein